MKTLILKRPKDKEKFYDESNFKIFINGKFLAKLGQNDIKEVTIQEDKIEIQAKKFRFDCSKKEMIELEERTEVEINRVLYLNNPSLIMFLFPMIFTVLYSSDIYWLRVFIVSLSVILFFWLINLYIKNKNKTIKITKI
ncbi:MAG: hypothetical protein AB1777_01705 [Bacteroidota bacterium]